MTLRLKIILSLLIGVTVLVASFAVYKVVRYLQAHSDTQKAAQEHTTVPAQQDSFFQNLNTPESPTSGGEQKQGGESAPQSQINGGEKTRADLISLALPFAERFGSYSNQSNFANLEDLMPFMSASMRAWAQGKIDTVRNAPVPALYKGTTTKALASIVLSLDEGKGQAQIRVSTQRKELIGTSTNFKVYTQDLLVTFSKQDTAWLVDSAVWQ